MVTERHRKKVKQQQPNGSNEAFAMSWIEKNLPKDLLHTILPAGVLQSFKLESRNKSTKRLVI